MYNKSIQLNYCKAITHIITTQIIKQDITRILEVLACLFLITTPCFPGVSFYGNHFTLLYPFLINIDSFCLFLSQSFNQIIHILLYFACFIQHDVCEIYSCIYSSLFLLLCSNFLLNSFYCMNALLLFVHCTVYDQLSSIKFLHYYNDTLDIVNILVYISTHLYRN